MKTIITLALALATTFAGAATATEEYRFDHTVQTLQYIQQKVRNPDSTVWEDIGASEDGKIVCVQLRSQNGFGGMARMNVTVVSDGAYYSAAKWNTYCKKATIDMMFARKAL
jgi:hypothetical protein